VLSTTDVWGVFTHGSKALRGYLRRLRAGGDLGRGVLAQVHDRDRRARPGQRARDHAAERAASSGDDRDARPDRSNNAGRPGIGPPLLAGTNGI